MAITINDTSYVGKYASPIIGKHTTDFASVTKGLLYVASRNVGGNGPAPHHTSNCSGRNGWYDIYDINTWQKVGGRFEAMPDCYSFDSRFKN